MARGDKAGRRPLLGAGTTLLALGLLLSVTSLSSRAAKSPTQISGVPIPKGQIDTAIRGLDALAGDLVQRSGVPGMAVIGIAVAVLVSSKTLRQRIAGGAWGQPKKRPN